ncbi:MAG: hypothetical protein ACHQ4H_12825 [Ktedonobacterales bacterium]
MHSVRHRKPSHRGTTPDARAVRRAAQVLPCGVLLALLAVLLASCAGGGGSTSGAARATSTPAGGSSASASPAATASPSTAAITTPGAPVGAAGLCALTPSVSAQPPASIPAYPGAKLRVGQSQNGGGLFGYCTSAGVAAVADYYTAQLPADGWQNVSGTTIDTTRQFTASRGSAGLIVTILPDSQLAGNTDIILTTSGG